MPSWGLKAAGGLIVLLAVLALTSWVLNTKNERDNLLTWQQSVLTATKSASDNPKLTADGVVQQINFLGTTLDGFRSATDKQNTAVKDWERRSVEAAIIRDQEIAKRASAVARAEQLSARLKAESLTPVERVDLERQLRETQDAAREAGL